MNGAQAVRAALDAGDLLQAYDLAEQALDAPGDDRDRLEFLRVLVLARMGDVDRALDLHHRLQRQDDEDVAALKGRLLKDKAVAASGDRRVAALRLAQHQYLETYRRTGGYFSGINAATLAAMAGSLADAREIASEVLALPALQTPGDYWAAATRGEALLLLGQGDASTASFAAAVGMSDATPAARAATLRQVGLVASPLALDPCTLKDIQTVLRPPPVIVWSGHMFRTEASLEARLRDGIAAVLGARGSTLGYGALAAGFDILAAETILARAGSVHIVLPFDERDFVERSVRPFGTDWVPRYDAVRARASSVVLAAANRAIDDPGQFDYASRVTLGLAHIHADALSTGVVALAGWDGIDNGGKAGTAADVRRFRALGLEPEIVWHGRREARAAGAEDAAPARRHASILFTDYAGYSRLEEAQFPHFWSGVMARIGAKLAEHRQDVLASNSWGDAFYAVIDTPAAAAQLALEIAEVMADFDPASIGLADGGMRIAIHHGQVYEVTDATTGQPTYIGGAVNLTARIEPVTPVGAVYATAAFAAMLRLGTANRFELRYMGTLPLAKSYGAFPLYDLRRALPPSAGTDGDAGQANAERNR